MSSVIIERSDVMSARSHAACRVVKLRLAASRKPGASKPSGTPQFCEPLKAEPIIEPPAAPATPAPMLEPAAGWKAMLLWSNGRADASLPTLSGLYWRATGAWSGVAPPAPAPWKANGDELVCVLPLLARAFMIMRITANAAMASKAIIRMLPKPSPSPSELASHARPRPAARPPSIAPQGFLGAAAAAGAPAGRAGAAELAFWAGAPGVASGRVASRWVTLLDCLPTDFPPPMRRAASASKCAIASIATKTTDQSFIMRSP